MLAISHPLTPASLRQLRRMSTGPRNTHAEEEILWWEIIHWFQLQSLDRDDNDPCEGITVRVSDPWTAAAC